MDSATGLYLAISLVWGSSWIANQILSEQGGPLQTAVLRSLYGAAFLAIAGAGQRLVRRRRQTPGQSSSESGPAPATYGQRFAILRAFDHPGEGRDWVGNSMILGVTMFALPDLLLLGAAHHGAAPWTPLIYAGLPLGLLLAAGQLRPAAVLGLGAMLVVLNGSLPLSVGKLSWALLIVAAVALQGWSLLYARRHLAAVSTVRSVTVQLAVAACLLELALKSGLEPAGPIPLRYWPASALGALGLLAILATAIAYPLYYRLLTHFEPAQLATSAWLQTLAAVGESAALLRQRPGWPMLGAGCVLVACALILLHRETGRIELDLG